MENILIEKTSRTPKVSLNADEGSVEIAGRSIPENSIMFYKPIFDWLDTFQNKISIADLHVALKLEYFNTSSSKCILDMFRKLESFNGNGKNIKVQWFYDPRDEDMEDAGKDFKDIINLPFELVKI
jgi:SiaC family regulatory phosphoprotein